MVFIEIFLGGLTYIYNANLSAKAVSLREHIMPPSATNALPYIIHARSDELKLDNTTHANRKWAESG